MLSQISVLCADAGTRYEHHAVGEITVLMLLIALSAIPAQHLSGFFNEMQEWISELREIFVGAKFYIFSLR
jgi:hypothetical protein